MADPITATIAAISAKVAAAKVALTGFYMSTLGVSSATAALLSSATLTVGFNVAAGAIQRGLAPSGPRPDDVQSSFRQALPPRLVHFGRMKVSGPWVFGEAKNGSFYKVLALNHGLIDAFEELWIDDTQVTVDGSDLVVEAPWTGKVKIQTRLGEATSTAYSDLDTEFTEYTTDHRLDGVATLYARMGPVGSDKFLKTYPNGINTTFKAVIRGVKCYDFVNENTTWTDNAARIIYWWMTNPDGMAIPPALLTTPQALAGWEAAQNICDELIDLNAGGTEKRWRLWGSADLANENHGDVLARMLACCDARIRQSPDGGWYLDVGKWVEPTVTLGPDEITGIYNFSSGRAIMDTANVIKATFLDVANGYVRNQIDPWVDLASVALRGEAVASPQYDFAPSHTQARRLAKKSYYMLNPDWQGTIEVNNKGLKALGERYVRITYPAFGIDEVFEIEKHSIIIEGGDKVMGLTLDIVAMPAASDAWDKTTEEGVPPGADATVVSSTVPVPANFTGTVTSLAAGRDSVAVVDLAWDAPTDDGLKTELRYKKTASSVWLAISINLGDLEAQSPTLDDGAQYEFQARHVSLGGTASLWTSSVTLTATADATAPGVPTGVSGTGGVGTAAIAWTTPNSANFSRSRVYRNSSNTFAGSTLRATVYSASSTIMGYDDTVAAGTWYYFVTSENGSGVASAAVGTGAVTVT